MTHPSTDYYTLGRGVLSAAEFQDGSPGAFQDVGNCPRFNVSLSEEEIAHYSSRSGLKTKDRVVTLQVGYTLYFDLDEISRENLARFVKGAIDGDVVHALTAADKTFALKFVSQNAVGPDQIWEFHQVKLSPASAFDLIGDDFSRLSFTAEGASDVDNHPTSPFFDVTASTTTTTTTTTTTA